MNDIYQNVTGIQFKVKQKRQEIEDAHEEQKIRLEATQKAKLKNLWSLINELNLTMSKSSKKHAADFEELEAKHESSLNKLNAEVSFCRDVVSNYIWNLMCDTFIWYRLNEISCIKTKNWILFEMPFKQKKLRWTG